MHININPGRVQLQKQDITGETTGIDTVRIDQADCMIDMLILYDSSIYKKILPVGLTTCLIT